ncbi:MAG: Heat-inducible transcription repressor HrcA [Holosporales bacterium]
MKVREINQRSNEIFKELVESYVETGEPVGSRTISRRLTQTLSPATIRNIMADLEDAGLLYSPHISAGRLPTDHGLQYFVNALLEVSDITDLERQEIESNIISCQLDDILQNASKALSGLSQCACIVAAPRIDPILSHIEFVYLSSNRALVVLVDQDDMIENRVISLPENTTPDVLHKAAQCLNQHIYGKTLNDLLALVREQRLLDQSDLDALTSKVVSQGLAVWSDTQQKGHLIIKGQSRLLDSIHAMDDLEKIRQLFNTLDTTESVDQLLRATLQADGVQIFIGSENNLFTTAGCSAILAPYQNANNKIIGAIGVVGPARMNYRRVIPLVDYTAKLIGKLMKGN